MTIINASAYKESAAIIIKSLINVQINGLMIKNVSANSSGALHLE